MESLRAELRRAVAADVAAELPRHYLQACLLLLIRLGLRGPNGEAAPAYGYNLRDQLIGLGVIQNDWGRLYRTLRTMEREGLLLSCWENSEAGPSRRTYHVTEKGTAQLQRWVQSMGLARGLVDKFLARYDAPGFAPREGVSNL